MVMAVRMASTDLVVVLPSSAPGCPRQKPSVMSNEAASPIFASFGIHPTLFLERAPALTLVFRKGESPQ